jgi:hypothetical protein
VSRILSSLEDCLFPETVCKKWVHRTGKKRTYSGIKLRRMRWAEYVARMGEVRNADNIFAGRPEGKRPLGKPRRRWEDNIRIGLREIVWEVADWLYLAQYMNQWQALLNTVMNFRVP